MSLSDTAIKAAKSTTGKSYKLPDANGLYLLIHHNGSKYFRFDFTFNAKRKTLALGVYPGTTLKQARLKRDDAKKLLANGVDPSQHKKETALAKAESLINTFSAIAIEWGEKQVKGWDDKHSIPRRRLEKFIFPHLGNLPITDILAKDILRCLRLIEAQGLHVTAHKVLQLCGQVFRYGVATGKVDRDITPDLQGALKPATKCHLAAITEPKEIGGLLRAIDNYNGTYSVKAALQIAPLVFVRPGELIKAEWSQVDFDTCEWRYFVTKTKLDHIVPLSKQSIEILTNLRAITGNSRYIFQTHRGQVDKTLSSNTLVIALRTIGYDDSQMTMHGFRAMARTVLDEVLKFRPDFIEHQLAHAVKDANGRAYNRTSHLIERKKMMQVWSDYLDNLKGGAKVVVFRKSVN
jgi:integrase